MRSITTPYGPVGYSPLRHLYRSQVQVFRLSGSFDLGAPSYVWEPLTAVLDPVLNIPGQMLCRIDLQFLRPGKDAPMPIVAGRPPDRTGTMFYDAIPMILAGDRFVCTAGPIVGTFELRQVPEPAQDYFAVHHFENQVIEVAQTVAGVIYPGGPDVPP